MPPRKTPTPRRGRDGFTLKERLYVKEYLVDLHQTNAAIRAGYSKNVATAKNHASRLMKAEHIKKAIAEGMTQRVLRLDVNADRVVQELASIGFAKLGADYVNTAEKKAALDSLARHLGLFKDRVDMGVGSKTELKITFV